MNASPAAKTAPADMPLVEKLPVRKRPDGAWELPGIANLHSHAFQRAMAGLAERMTHPSDSFWTWRETMYRMAERFDPERLHAVAAQLYVEMLEAGYTSVCEFHYLHHAPDGTPYTDPAAMSHALIAAARETGIRLTLLPTLYMTGGFDGRTLNARQRRFGHTVDSYLRLFETLHAEQNDTLRIGCALHSLRAVPPQAMAAVVSALPRDARLHIHIAEQIGEVQDSLAIRGERPVRWLLDNADIDARWTLVHATHLDVDEIVGIADSGATVALCPTTEANLGDGVFPVRDYLDAEGAWGVGSDSHISVSPVEELRWLEYGQRLLTRHRNIVASAAHPSVSEVLLAGVWRSASQATGFDAEVLRQDAVILDADAPQLIGATSSDVLDRWVFSGNRPLVDRVDIGGQVVVQGGRHRDREPIAKRFAATMLGLLAE
jgi:formimidoylglutamate deiminase